VKVYIYAGSEKSNHLKNYNFVIFKRASLVEVEVQKRLEHFKNCVP